MHTGDAGHIPWFGLLQRTQEHFIHTQGVGAILVANVVRVDYVVLGFGHFFDIAANLKCSVNFSYKMSFLIFRQPVLESFYIKFI